MAHQIDERTKICIRCGLSVLDIESSVICSPNFTQKEVDLLLSMINGRIVEAQMAGIPADHPSSEIRDSIFHKLMRTRLY